MRRPFKDKTVAVIAGGEIRDLAFAKRMIKKSDYVICVDGGFDHAKKMGIKPHIIIGDLDSICLKKERIKVKRYSCEKDYSDTELALRHAASRGAKDMILLGALGKRFDHALANIFAASNFPGGVRIIDEYVEIVVYDRAFVISGKKGDTVSLIPFFSNVSGIDSFGLKYRLKGLTLKANSRGISNEMTAGKAKVSFKKGKLLVIKVRKR